MMDFLKETPRKEEACKEKWRAKNLKKNSKKYPKGKTEFFGAEVIKRSESNHLSLSDKEVHPLNHPSHPVTAARHPKLGELREFHFQSKCNMPYKKPSRNIRWGASIPYSSKFALKMVHKSMVPMLLTLLFSLSTFMI